jgi:sulfopropanediol 3-dehydrogenase
MFMKLIKPGGHRLFEHDPETAKMVSDMLFDLEKHGMDAVRKYSEQFDKWNPERFELSDAQINEAIDSLPRQVIEDTDYCQSNVRRFA